MKKSKLLRRKNWIKVITFLTVLIFAFAIIPGSSISIKLSIESQTKNIDLFESEEISTDFIPQSREIQISDSEKCKCIEKEKISEDCCSNVWD